MTTTDVFDCETLKKEKEGYKYILDATGKYNYLTCRLRDNGAKKHYFAKDREQIWKNIVAKGLAEHKRGGRYHVFFFNAKYDFFNIADLNDSGIRIFSREPFIASYYIEINKEIEGNEQMESWKTWAKMHHMKWTETYLKETNKFIVTYQKEIIKFLDVMALYRMDLKSLGKALGENKIEMPNLSTFKSKKEMDKALIEYCYKDVEVTMKALQYLKGKLSEENIILRNLCTINQVAINYLLNKLKNIKGAENILWTNSDGRITTKSLKKGKNRLIREAYRGGYVRVWKTGKFDKLNVIDCNSLYPYSAINMRCPDIRTQTYTEEPLKYIPKYQLLEKIGISKCIIENITDELGLLQIRMIDRNHVPTANPNTDSCVSRSEESLPRNKKGKTMIGTWTHTELEEAERNGYVIKDIKWSITYNDAKINPLKELFLGIYAKRLECQQNNDKMGEQFYKDMMNRGIGKFAQEKTGWEMFIDSVEKVDEYKALMIKAISGIEGSTNYLYAEKGENIEKEYYCPIIPTLINAYARVYMYKMYKRIPKEILVYSDTDSIIWEGYKEWLKEFPIGNELGMFKIEKNKETGKEKLEIEGLIYGSKTKMTDGEISISGMGKKNITEQDFKKGEVKSIKMEDITTGKIGEFIETNRDLNKQTEEFDIIMTKLKNQELFIDINSINYIDYFLKHLKGESLNTNYAS